MSGKKLVRFQSPRQLASYLPFYTTPKFFRYITRKAALLAINAAVHKLCSNSYCPVYKWGSNVILGPSAKKWATDPTALQPLPGGGHWACIHNNVSVTM
jgi:hypothetical protein